MIIIVILLILLAIGVFPKLIKIAGNVLAVIFFLAVIGVTVWMLIMSYGAVLTYNRASFLIAIIEFAIGALVLWKIQPREFYLKLFLKIYLVAFGVVTIYLLAVINESFSMWLASGYSLSWASIVAAVWFPIDRASFFRKFKKKALIDKMYKNTEPLTTDEICEKMNCPKKRFAFFLELINKAVAEDSLAVIRIKEEDYLFHMNHFNELTADVEKYLLENGTRSVFQIQDSVTGKSMRGVFLTKVLGILTKSDKVKKISIGKDPANSSPEQFIYSHVNRKMVSREIDIDDDDE